MCGLWSSFDARTVPHLREHLFYALLRLIWHCQWLRDSVCVCILLVTTDNLYFFYLAARRFKKQIFLSIDIPPTFLSMGHGPKLAFEAEKRVVETLKELEK